MAKTSEFGSGHLFASMLTFVRFISGYLAADGGFRRQIPWSGSLSKPGVLTAKLMSRPMRPGADLRNSLYRRRGRTVCDRI